MAIVPREQIDESQQQETTEETTEETTQAPSFATTEEVTTLKNSLSEIRELLSANLRAPQPQQTQTQPAHVEQPIDDVSDEELETYFVEGKGGVAKKFRTAVNAAVERRVRTVEAKLEEMQRFGVESIGNLSERVSQSDTPYLKHEKLGKVIKGELDRAYAADPRLKTDPRIIKAIHDRVVGENRETIINEEVEARIRKSRENPTSSQPTNANGRTTPSEPQTPTPQELIGMNLTIDEADEWARRVLGYKEGWKGYVAVIQKQREGMAS